MKLLLGFCLALIFSNTFSQKAKLKCYVSPPNAIIELDGKKISNYSLIDIEVGNHTISVSQLHYLTADSTIVVQSDSLNRVYIRLVRDPVYLNYRLKLKEYKTSNIMGIGSSFMMLGGSLFGFKIASNVIETKRDKQYDLVLEAEFDYYDNINPENIEDLRSDFYLKKEKYTQLVNRKNANKVIGITVASVALGLTIYSIVKAIKREKPEYNDEVSALLLFPYYNNDLGTSGLTVFKTF